MKKLLIGLTLLGSVSSFASHDLQGFIHANELEVCKDGDVGKANFFSFAEIVRSANVGSTKFHLSGDDEYVNPKYAKPNFFECLLLIGEDCDRVKKVKKVEVPSNFEEVVYEILQDNSKSEKYFEARGNGYGPVGTVQGMRTYLDLEVSPVAGQINSLSSKLVRLTGKFQGDISDAR